MFLKSPDPTAHAVIGGGYLYPVSEGVFSVPDQDAHVFEGYERADEVSPDAAAKLAEAGRHEHAVEEPPAAEAPGHSGLAGPSHLDELVQQLTAELKSAIAEKNAAVAEVERLLADAEKPFEIVGGEILDKLHIEVDHAARVISVAVKADEDAKAAAASEEEKAAEPVKKPARKGAKAAD